jgi:GT2 family glycosyltransferase
MEHHGPGTCPPRRAPLVSVVIPWHRGADLLRRSVTSVLAQTHPRIEVVVVDDASEEGVPADLLAAATCAHRVVVVRTDVNVGPGGARELGRQAATGDLIGYLDADDEWAPEFAACHAATLAEHPWAGMSHCRTLVVDDELGPSAAPVPLDRDRPVPAFLPYVFGGRPWSTSACLWRREACDRIGPWLASTRAWEDYDYDARAGAVGLLPVMLDAPLCTKHEATGHNLSSEADARKVVGRATSISNLSRCLREHGAATGPTLDHLLDAAWASTQATARIGRRDLTRRTALEVARLRGRFPGPLYVAGALAASSLPARLADRIIGSLRIRAMDAHLGDRELSTG